MVGASLPKSKSLAQHREPHVNCVNNLTETTILNRKRKFLAAVAGRSLDQMRVAAEDIESGFARIQEPLSFPEIEAHPAMKNLANFNKVKDQLRLLKRVDPAQMEDMTSRYVDHMAEWLAGDPYNDRSYAICRTLKNEPKATVAHIINEADPADRVAKSKTQERPWSFGICILQTVTTDAGTIRGVVETFCRIWERIPCELEQVNV